MTGIVIQPTTATLGAIVTGVQLASLSDGDWTAIETAFHAHRGKVGASYGFTDGPPPLRPLVKVHPVTGRKSLYIGRHAYGIPGLDSRESERLLEELVAFACQPPRVYQHEWRAGDVVVWDNRCVLHRARPYDHREARVMKHTRVAGDPATETAMVSETPAPVPVPLP